MAKGLLAILGKPSPDEESGDGGDSPDDMGSAKAKKIRAIKRLFAAMKSGDAEAGAEAFYDAFRACEDFEGEGPADETDEGDSGEG